MDFGTELRRWRTKRDLSLAGLARLTHYSKSYLSKIENGDKPATPDVAQRCDEALDADGALTDLLPPEVVIPLQVSGDQCPYRGLAAFDAEDARWFFGRERAVAALVDRLGQRWLAGGPVIVVAPSGAGKSSLLRAGLVPALARGVLPAAGSRDWPVRVFTPTSDPLGALAAQLASIGSADGMVLIVDQFEETFTLCPDERQREQFVAELCGLASGEPKAAVVLGVRADFYGQLLSCPDLVPSLQDGQVALGPLGPDELRAAIVQPARLAGLGIEQGLVELLVRDLGGRSGSYDPGALPLLGHALLTTWQNRDSRQLTVAGYQLTGGIHEAVANTAERTFTGLDEHSQAIARRLLLRLVRVDRHGQTRARADFSQLSGHSVLTAFIRARLLTAGTGTVEITHEALLTAWPRLREWIEADRIGLLARQRLSEAADEWENHARAPKLLYQGAALAVARAWAADHPDELTASERDFLRAGKREQQRGVRRLRRLVALLSVLVLLAAAATGAALWQQKEAANQRDVAVAQKVAGRAGELRATNPALAMQFALAAYQRKSTVETRGAVLSSGTPFASRFHSAGDWVEAVAYSTDDEVLAVGTSDGVIELWDATNPRRQEPLGTLPRAEDKVWQLAFHDRTLVAATGTTPVLWDVSNPAAPARLASLSGHRAPVRGAAFTADGARLVTTSTDGVAQVWDVTGSPRLIRTMRDEQDIGTAVAVSPDGNTLLTAHSGSRARLWDLATGLPGAVVPCPRHTFGRATFSPDGRFLALANNDGQTWLSTKDSPGGFGPAEPLAGMSSLAWGLAFSPDSTRLATAGNDRMARVWDVTTRAELIRLRHPNRVLSVAFSHDGRTLAAGGIAGSFHLWHDPMVTVSGQLALIGTSRDRQLFATSAGTAITLWDAGLGRLSTLPAHHVASVGTAVISDDKKIMATVAYDHDVVLWNIADPRAPRFLHRLDMIDEEVVTAALRPDGTLLATGDNSGVAMLWDLADPTAPRKLVPLRENFRNVNALDFSPDGTRLVTGDTNHGVRLWDVSVPSSPRQIAHHTDHTEAVAAVRHAPDGTVISTSHDWSVRLWRPGTASVRLTGHTNQVGVADLSPDGRLLATAAADGTIRLWDLRSATTWAALTQPGSGLGTGLFTADSRGVVTASGGHMRLWDTDVDAVAQRICSLAGQHVTRDEWAQQFDSAAYSPPCA
ncbi:helix-turn-helix domain-containing protein [Lentzea sp. NPDC051838]|uniref:nSTAND1 domain-containing NTPase n=1 Tax=Lentzea sp. NPDC051838 TaxID=3154849 RepID=UPI003446E5E7